MSVRHCWVVVIILMGTSSCSPPAQTPLEKAASSLSPGMNKTNVEMLFSGFKVSAGTFEGRKWICGDTKPGGRSDQRFTRNRTDLRALRSGDGAGPNLPCVS